MARGENVNTTGRPSTGARRAVIGVALAALVATGTVFALMRPAPPPPAPPEPTCAPVAEPTLSVARRWDEALLDAIRRSLPNPPVHARNLFHFSIAMWDAWAAYAPTASGYVFTEKPPTSDVTAARTEAISYAAYHILT